MHVSIHITSVDVDVMVEMPVCFVARNIKWETEPSLSHVLQKKVNGKITKVNKQAGSKPSRFTGQNSFSGPLVFRAFM